MGLSPDAGKGVLSGIPFKYSVRQMLLVLYNMWMMLLSLIKYLNKGIQSKSFAMNSKTFGKLFYFIGVLKRMPTA